jgi:hypothetical protein
LEIQRLTLSLHLVFFSIIVAFAGSVSNIFTLAGDETYADGLSVSTNTAVGILVLGVWSILNSLRIDFQG